MPCSAMPAIPKFPSIDNDHIARITRNYGGELSVGPGGHRVRSEVRHIVACSNESSHDKVGHLASLDEWNEIEG